MEGNCIQYRVTGGGGGGGSGESSTGSNGGMAYRVVNSSEGETTSTTRTSISSSSSALSNVQAELGRGPLLLGLDPTPWTPVSSIIKRTNLGPGEPRTMKWRGDGGIISTTG